MELYANYNLNKVTPDELKEHKEKMEKLYLKNAILPHDEGFEYDKQKDFNTDVYDAEWDD